MRQRVSIARTLAYDPDVFLMDETFGAFDAQTKLMLQQQLLNLWDGKASVFNAGSWV
jgi:NitT/TauT family transport system ATP-binding protein